jgi:hypothetical protein
MTDAVPPQVDKILPAETRLWIYRIAIAIIPLLVILGVITADIGGSILFIIASVLGLGAAGLAERNVNRQ